MKKTNTFTNIAMLVLFAAMAVYLGVYLFRSTQQSYSTAPAVLVTVSEGGQASGIVVREEQVIASDKEFLSLSVDDGKEVASGGEIAIGVDSKAALDSASRARELKKEIAYVSSLLSRAGSASGASELDSSVHSAILRLNAAVSAGSASELDDICMDLSSLLFGASTGTVSQGDLDALNAELHQLDKAGVGRGSITAPAAGLAPSSHHHLLPLFMSNMRSQYFWFSLACTALLASCGGGSSDGGDVGPAPGVQQYPGGVWEGTVGTGAAQRQVVGYIDPGPQGTGGEFYLAREAPGAAGFDALYGRLNVSVTSVLATGVTYFSVQDGKFATGLTLRGTASNSGKIGRTDAISGNYSDPVQTAAASGATVPLKLAYSSLNFHTASASLIEGTYRGTGLFGGGWVLTVTPQGQLSGRIGGCLATGSATPRAAGSPLYSLTINLSGDTTSCGATGTQQSGIAVLRYDAAGVPNGIWAFTRNATGTDNTYTLNGIADPRTTAPPSATPLSVAGNWQGSFTLPTGVIGDTTVWGSVLPDGGLFF